MPNIPQQQTIVQYVANSSQTNYTFAFYAVAPQNIAVYYQAANATPIPASDILTLNVDYTVTFNADPTTGGFITLLFTPTTGFYLTISLALQTTLNTNFANAQNFNGANLDAALDYLLMLIQQVTNYALNRNLSYVINTYLPDAVPFTQLPPLQQNQVWIGSAAGVVAGTVASSPSASLLQSMLANNSPGTDGGRLIGYYDAVNSNPTTVTAFLANLPSFLAALNVNYGVDSGSANALVAGNALGAKTLYAGLVVEVRVSNTTTNSVTLNWNSTGVISVKYNNANLISGNLQQNQTYQFSYNGTNWELLTAPFTALATNVQALGGVDMVHPVTSAGLASQQSVTSNGYTTLPGGLILQWGATSSIAPNGNNTVTFPIAFTSACFNVTTSAVNSTSGVVSSGNVGSVTTANFILYNTTQSGSGNAFFWFAIGK